MYLRLLALVLCSSLISCKDFSKKEDILPKETMEKILLDINLAESYSTMVRDSAHKLGNKHPDSLATYYRDIFAHHKVTREQFEKSLAWYKKNPDDMDTLINEIIPVVTQMTLTK
jgi:uncharacterized protein YcaQ